MSPTISHSYSRLSTFEQCAAKFDYLYVTRNVQDDGNEFTLFGNRVHEGMELIGKAAVEGVSPPIADYPIELQPYVELVRRVAMQPGEKHFELRVAITQEFKPCEWMAPDVWLRGILDVLVLNGSRAVVLDWKTGKVRDNPTQLQLFAALVFTLYPQVEEVRAAFVWLGHNQLTDSIFHRRDAWRLWEGLVARFRRVEDAVDLGVFKPRPSPLCRWCPAKRICPEART